MRPLDGALAMSTMRFADEVVARSDIDALPRSVAKPTAKELKLASQIVDALASDWKPGQYHDTYTEELRDLITRKGTGEEIVVENDDSSDDAKVLDLMAALQASVDEAKGRRSGARAAKKAGATRTAKKAAATKKAATTTTASKKAATKKKATSTKAAANKKEVKRKAFGRRSAQRQVNAG